MAPLINSTDAIALFPSLKEMEPTELEASLLRASIYVDSQTVYEGEVPSDIKLATCLLVQIEKDGPQIKEISRDDYKEVYDTTDTRWQMVNSILKKYTVQTTGQNIVSFL